MKFNIIKSLDTGAFGTVYEIEADDNKRYALKELKNFDMVNKELFEREIKILSEFAYIHSPFVSITTAARIWPSHWLTLFLPVGVTELNHPNIVKIFQWNIGGDPPNFMPYYIMEYLAGGSLRQHMDESFRNDERYVFERKWTINRIILATCNA